MRNDSHGGQLFSAKVATNHPISTEPFVCWSQGPLVCGLCSSEEPGSGHKGAKTPPPTPRARSGFPTSGSTRKMIPTCIVSSYCALLNPGPCTRPPFMGPQSAATPPPPWRRRDRESQSHVTMHSKSDALSPKARMLATGLFCSDPEAQAQRGNQPGRSPNSWCGEAGESRATAVEPPRTRPGLLLQTDRLRDLHTGQKEHCRSWGVRSALSGLC